MAYNVYFICEKCDATHAWINTSVPLNTAIHLARNYGWQVGKTGWFCPTCRTRKRRINDAKK